MFASWRVRAWAISAHSLAIDDIIIEHETCTSTSLSSSSLFVITQDDWFGLMDYLLVEISKLGIRKVATEGKQAQANA
jgi:hypothetical protein